MKILTNKFFILGNLLLLLIAIPLTLYFVKKQQELRSKAAASSKLYIDPPTTNTSTTCQNFTADLTIDPGTNLISIVNFYITYDPTLLEITQITPSASFPSIVRASSITAGAANMSVSIGSDVTRAVSSIAKVATITFIPKGVGTAQINIDSGQSSVFSLGPSDATTENVLSSVVPGSVTIGSAACLTGGISPTSAPGVTGTLSPTPTIGVANNQSPVCTSLTVSPSATGSAPFSVLFTGAGNDPDINGLITKATFTFGDGQVQDVTTGLNQKSVNTQASHTYQNPGTYPATVVFTDNQSALSQACSQNVTASGSGSLSPTATPIIAATSTPIPIPTAVPTIPPMGSLAQTLGIIVAVVVTITGGLLLLAL